MIIFKTNEFIQAIESFTVLSIFPQTEEVRHCFKVTSHQMNCTLLNSLKDYFLKH